ncbi:MAG: (d)CMP kinase [Chloroflexi bacterium]|nr:(d)CMP kinase [Chloroflexota bacterium]
MSKPASIAIDGPGGAGKNSVGRLLAKRLGYRIIDTGAMYRALTWKLLRLGIDLGDEEELSRLARETEIDLVPGLGGDEDCRVKVSGIDVSSHIRGEDVERYVSQVSKAPGVRDAMVAQQRKLAQQGRVVMIGRDIGAVVLPDADLKIYLDASANERARRKYREMVQQGKQADYDRILADLERRDRIDSERAVSPLRPAEDAVIINTDGLDLPEVLSRIIQLIDSREQ